MREELLAAASGPGLQRNTKGIAAVGARDDANGADGAGESAQAAVGAGQTAGVGAGSIAEAKADGLRAQAESPATTIPAHAGAAGGVERRGPPRASAEKLALAAVGAHEIQDAFRIFVSLGGSLAFLLVFLCFICGFLLFPTLLWVGSSF